MNGGSQANSLGNLWKRKGFPKSLRSRLLNANYIFWVIMCLTPHTFKKTPGLTSLRLKVQKLDLALRWQGELSKFLGPSESLRLSLTLTKDPITFPMEG